MAGSLSFVLPTLCGNQLASECLQGVCYLVVGDDRLEHPQLTSSAYGENLHSATRPRDLIRKYLSVYPSLSNTPLLAAIRTCSPLQGSISVCVVCHTRCASPFSVLDSIVSYSHPMKFSQKTGTSCQTVGWSVSMPLARFAYAGEDRALGPGLLLSMGIKNPS